MSIINATQTYWLAAIMDKRRANYKDFSDSRLAQRQKLIKTGPDLRSSPLEAGVIMWLKEIKARAYI